MSSARPKSKMTAKFTDPALRTEFKEFRASLLANSQRPVSQSSSLALVLKEVAVIPQEIKQQEADSDAASQEKDKKAGIYKLHEKDAKNFFPFFARIADSITTTRVIPCLDFNDPSMVSTLARINKHFHSIYQSRLDALPLSSMQRLARVTNAIEIANVGPDDGTLVDPKCKAAIESFYKHIRSTETSLELLIKATEALQTPIMNTDNTPSKYHMMCCVVGAIMSSLPTADQDMIATGPYYPRGRGGRSGGGGHG